MAPLCQGRDVVCYGSSLGAYAALYYGGSIGARIIAAAPMLPAWRPLNIRAYYDLPMHHVELHETPRSPVPPVVIYDPMLKRDRFVVDRMVRRAYPDVRLIDVPYGGHTVLVTLSQARLLKPITVALIERGEIIPFTPPGAGTAIWHAQNGKAIMRSDIDAAIAELKTSLSIQPHKQTFCILIDALLRKGDLAEIQRQLDAGRGNPILTVVPSLQKRLAEIGLNP